MRTTIVLSARVLTGVIAALLLAKAAFANDTPDRTTLAPCVEQHFTPADAGTMTHLTVMILLNVGTDANDFRDALADKRDLVIADAARLITRLTEQDCKPQVDAVNAASPPGFLFKSLFQQLMVLGMRSLQREDAKRASVVFALDLVKKLDSNVAVDLMGRQATAGSTTPAVPNNTAGASVSGEVSQ
jgi:hypothetical protein